MGKRVWNSGPPPHVGWWNASTQRDEYAWRWWGGKMWSCAANNRCTDEVAAKRASTPIYEAGTVVLWTDYYPEGARVPRINPETLKETTNEKLCTG